jgi:hypothetical protein
MMQIKLIFFFYGYRGVEDATFVPLSVLNRGLIGEAADQFFNPLIAVAMQPEMINARSIETLTRLKIAHSKKHCFSSAEAFFLFQDVPSTVWSNNCQFKKEIAQNSILQGKAHASTREKVHCATNHLRSASCNEEDKREATIARSTPGGEEATSRKMEL